MYFVLSDQWEWLISTLACKHVPAIAMPSGYKDKANSGNKILKNPISNTISVIYDTK